jgi:hypothetical protein
MRPLWMALLVLGLLPAGAEAFAVGDTVKVIGSSALNVRVCPAGTVKGTQAIGAVGVIVGGTGAVVSGHPRWDINYGTGADGCSAQTYLQVVAPDPGPTPPGGEQPPGTWVKVPFLMRTLYQSAMGGSQSIPKGQPGEAYSNCARPIQADGSGIVRSYSGTVMAGNQVVVFGGGHAGHPGNDIQFVDFLVGVDVTPYAPECPEPYVFVNGAWVPNPVWRGIRGGAVMTGGFSPEPEKRPWVEHLYNNAEWDAKRHRYLMINGNGLQAYQRPTTENPKGKWTLLVGNDRTQGEVIWGSSGGLLIDDVRDSLWAFVSASGNGATRGIYEYRFDAAGAVIEKRFLPWPASVPGWNWGAYNLITALYAKERRAALLFVSPSSTPSNVPPNRLWVFNLDTQAPPTWDQSLVPGRPAYDESWGTGGTQFRAVSRVPGQTWLKVPGGFWVQDDASGGTWTKVAAAGAPNLMPWTFACSDSTPYCIGITARSLYGVAGASSGGIADLWRYRRP